MAFNLNKVILAGKLGRDPEVRTFSNGSKLVTFSLATSETWTDKASGERKEQTEWHDIAIFNEKIGEIAERYLHKGSGVYLEGVKKTRKYTATDGSEKKVVEIVLPKFNGVLHFLDTGKSNSSASKPAVATPKRDEFGGDDLDDEIPF